MSGGAFDTVLPPLPGPVLVEAGHYTLARTPGPEAVLIPGFGSAAALTSPSTRATFSRALGLVQALRDAGTRADLGLMVGDLVLPAGARPAGGAWALPPSYRALLSEAGIPADEVQVWGEAYARNQGKRRLLDEAETNAEATYARGGWALLADGDARLLASDASLDWEGDVRAAVLARGPVPLCPLVFAGLKRALFQAGYQAHVAIYALADDPWIDVKLRAAAAAFSQLTRGPVGPQVDLLLRDSSAAARPRVWNPDELREPGERPWPAFLAELRHYHPGVHPLESPCPTPPPPSAPPCPPGTASSRCSS